MRAALLITLALTLVSGGLTACETSANEGGVADYDALRKATQECEARGGHLVLKDGGDAQYIQDYACKGK